MCNLYKMKPYGIKKYNKNKKNQVNLNKNRTLNKSNKMMEILKQMINNYI